MDRIILKTIVWYNGQAYGESFNFNGLSLTPSVNPKNEPFYFDELQVKETPSNIILKELKCSFNVVEEDFIDKGKFNIEKENDLCIFDKETKTISKLPKMSELKDYIKGGRHSQEERVCEFLWKIYSCLNQRVAQALFRHHYTYDPEYLVENLFLYANTNDALTIEKLITSTSIDATFNCLNTKGFKLNAGRKLKQILEIPQTILAFLKENNIEKLIPDFKILCSDDPNEGIFIVEYIKKVLKLKNFKQLKIEKDEYMVSNFIHTLSKIKTLSEIKMQVLIPYLIKQKVYYGSYILYDRHGYYYGSSRNPVRDIFLLPESEAKSYYDYLELGGTEATPYILKIAHDALLRNRDYENNQELSDKISNLSTKFEKYVFEDDDFLVTYPKNVKDLIEEGTQLCHCVATYAIPIATEMTNVFFIRKKDEPNVPFVTLEMDNDENIIQIKGKYDLDVSDQDVLNFIKKWTKKVL